MQRFASRTEGTEGGRFRLAAWLIQSRPNLPAETRLALVHSLYGNLAIFVVCAFSAIAVSSLIAMRIPQTPFVIWAAAGILIAAARVWVLAEGRKAIAEGRTGPIGAYVLLALAWAASVGSGTFLAIQSGDWVAATLACLSAAAMVGGICFRDFAAPRLCAAMIVLSLGPCAAAAVASGETIMLIVALQIPLYLASMTIAAFRLNALMVSTMLAERENDRRANHDALTGVLNRAGLARDIAERTARAEPFALFYLDLDAFKDVNDTFGHQVGDELLQAVAERLRLVARPDAAVARIGGDEFIVVSPGFAGSDVNEFGELMVSAIADGSYRIGAEVVEIRASVGAALYPRHGCDLGTLLGEADTALYRAKFWGRARCVVAGSNNTALAPAPRRVERNAA